MGNEEAPMTDDDISDTSPVRRRNDSKMENHTNKKSTPERRTSTLEE
jgi:hypothetical protein